jgi:hypothetical protein
MFFDGSEFLALWLRIVLRKWGRGLDVPNQKWLGTANNVMLLTTAILSYTVESAALWQVARWKEQPL